MVAGKHVLCEKPLVTSPHKLNDLVKLALKKNVLLMEAMHYQYHPTLSDFFKLINQEVLGPILEAHAFLRYYYPSAMNDIRLSRDLKGGCFMHLGCYCLDALTRIIPSSLSFKNLQILKQTDQVDLACKANLETLGGAIKASLYCDFSGHVFDSGLKIKGEKGYLCLKSALNPTNFCHQDPRDTVLLETNLPRPIALAAGNGKTTYDYQLNDFIERMQEGHFTPQVNQASSQLLIQGAEMISSKIHQNYHRKSASC